MIVPDGEQLFQTSEVTLSFVEGPPNGGPFLHIHGVASRWQPFQPVMTALIEKYHVYALDLRGHGMSGHAQGAYQLQDYTRDVQQFLDEQIREPAVVYGHSLGALIAINLAVQDPQHVRKLILGDPPLYYHNTAIQDTFWYKAFNELLDFKLAHPDLEEMRDWLAENMPNMSPERREERVRSLENIDPDLLRVIIRDDLMKGLSFSSLVSRVSCPVLLLRGNPERGSALREEDVDFALTHFQKIQMLIMETIGHSIIPVSLLPDLTRFIDG